MKQNKIDILILTEYKISKSIKPKGWDTHLIPGIKSRTSYNDTSRNNGIFMAFSNTLNKKLCGFKELIPGHLALIDFKFATLILTIIGVYAPANSLQQSEVITQDIYKNITATLIAAEKEKKTVLILGDFNASLIRNQKKDKNLQNYISQENLTVLSDPNFNTFKRGQAESGIDHILAKRAHLLHNRRISYKQIYPSDHQGIILMGFIEEIKQLSLLKTN